MDNTDSAAFGIADYLVTGFWTDFGLPPPRIADAGNVIRVDLSGLAPEGAALARAAFAAWEMVADLRFEEVTSGASLVMTDDGTDAWTSFGRNPASGETTACINIGAAWIERHGSTVGCYGFQTYVHEIGHALGLGHPGNYDGAAQYATDAQFQSDSWQQSVMSYFSQADNPTTGASFAFCLSPMMADILAIQRLYGAPQDGATAGDTTWGFGSGTGGPLAALVPQAGLPLSRIALTVFDESGLDTLDLSQDDRAQVVRLRAGTFSDVFGGTGNLAIAFGTTIERCLTGGGPDAVTGNEAANGISLGGGNDRAWGLGQADVLSGGTGSDVLHGGTGEDRLAGDPGGDLLFGGGGDDRLLGGSGADTLKAGAGDDVLQGGAGDDILTGGKGRDAFVFQGGRDTVTDYADGLDRLVLAPSLWEGRDLTPRLVVQSFATQEDGALMFRFPDGSELRLPSGTDLPGLAEDMVFL